MSQPIEILSDRAALTQKAVEIVLAAYSHAIAANGRFTFVAAGGNTPRLLYEELANQPLDWSKIHIFWGDERYVPASDPQSNLGMTRPALLDRVAIPPENIHPMPTEAGDPKLDAQNYENHLRKFFGLGDQPLTFPQFDLVLLGLGDDGHTASLFPHTAALAVSDRLITVGQKDGQPRLTFTASLINQAQKIVFLVEGKAKSEAVAKILASTGDVQTYPARLIQGNVIWLLDQAASQHLQTIG